MGEKKRIGLREYPALVFPAVAAFAPLGLRLSEAGWGQAPGLLSDALSGLALFLLILACPRPLRWVPAFFWALFQAGSAELVHALQRYPVWQDLHYLADADFLRNSADGLRLAAPTYAGVLFASAALTALARLPRLSRRALCVWALALALLFSGHSWWARRAGGGDLTAQYNPLHWFLADAASGIFRGRGEEAAALPPGLEHPDLSGASLLAGPGRAKNVLIVVLEGLPGQYIPEIRERLGVETSAVTMDRLAAAGREAMLIPDFSVHSHQTIRGLYAILCGDFSKFSWDTPKAFELQSAPERAADCLPAQLGRRGWSTHYLQAAGLGFMAKDRVMAQTGFAEAHGVEWFAEQGIQNPFPFEWGMVDAAFLEGARRYIANLRQAGRPWLLALLTVGTHQPYAAPDDVAERYPSRKDAAVALLDEAVGPFLDGLRADGVLEDTLVLVTSDESHGTELGAWACAWGLGMVLAPERAALPHCKAGGYGLVDTEVSVLDYLGLPVPPSVVGRSFFRDYEKPRDMLSFTGGALRVHTEGGLRYECEPGGGCLAGAAASILGPPPENMAPAGPEESRRLWGMARSLDNRLKTPAGERVLGFASGEQRRIPKEVGNDWNDNLIGAQYLDFPKGSDVEVRMRLTMLEAPEAGVQLRMLVKEQEENLEGIPLPELPVLHAGETLDQSFSFHNARAHDRFSFYLLGSGVDALLQIDRFDVVVREKIRTMEPAVPQSNKTSGER